MLIHHIYPNIPGCWCFLSTSMNLVANLLLLCLFGTTCWGFSVSAGWVINISTCHSTDSWALIQLQILNQVIVPRTPVNGQTPWQHIQRPRSLPVITKIRKRVYGPSTLFFINFSMNKKKSRGMKEEMHIWAERLVPVKKGWGRRERRGRGNNCARRIMVGRAPLEVSITLGLQLQVLPNFIREMSLFVGLWDLHQELQGLGWQAQILQHSQGHLVVFFVVFFRFTYLNFIWKIMSDALMTL